VRKSPLRQNCLAVLQTGLSCAPDVRQQRPLLMLRCLTGKHAQTDKTNPVTRDVLAKTLKFLINVTQFLRSPSPVDLH
jgi:hypothetical protein